MNDLAERVGENCLKNTLKVLENMDNHDTMVFGTETLTKAEIIERFKKDHEFALLVTDALDKSVKEYLVRKKYGAGGKRRSRKS